MAALSSAVKPCITIRLQNFGSHQEQYILAQFTACLSGKGLTFLQGMLVSTPSVKGTLVNHHNVR